jgi:methionyl-tRNA formyltransferase
MSSVKVCFLGTPEFAAQHLQTLINNSKYEVVGVVTQPDRPAGRKMQLTASAVKNLALTHGLTVLTPENLKKEPEVFEIIKSWKADVAVVVAFGQILSDDFLNSFKYGAVNIHGSLLPLWRGAAPIQRSLQAGDAVTGVALQKMVKKLDAGAIIASKKIELNNEINATELYQQLAVMGCELLNQELHEYVAGKITPTEQDENLVTVAAKINKDESIINWIDTALNIHNKVRAFSMGPGTYILFQNKRLKIHKTKVIDSNSVNEKMGSIIFISESELHIQTSVGILSILELQPESKSKMNTAEFLKSLSLKKGDRFA